MCCYSVLKNYLFNTQSCCVHFLRKIHCCLSSMDFVDCCCIAKGVVCCCLYLSVLFNACCLSLWLCLVFWVWFIFLFTTLDTIGKEREVRNEPEEYQDQDQGHIDEPGKPPHHYNESYYFIKNCFVFKIKWCMIHFFCGILPPKNYFTKYCLAKVIY